MTNKDKDIWDTYKRGVQKAPKTTRAPPPLAGGGRGWGPSETAKQATKLSSPIRQTAATDFTTSLEPKREKALRQGAFPIDAKLDLHGMTQPEAYDALAHFMQKKTKAGKRHLLIVTGKGRDGAGPLRSNLKNWLNHLPEAKLILAVRPAAPQHGGDGAFYVMLRKQKPAG